ncbi:hypothetical protein RL73_04445 [Liberibacter crescens]|nr:hypothetical protein RL73_04445 [Liberibacter crescens]
MAIVGAGIAGLTLALSLCRYGIKSDIFEQSDQFMEAGAGLQISPNASYLLKKIGVLSELESLWFEPSAIRLLSGITMKELNNIPCGSHARNQWGAPYAVLHRTTLRKTLLSILERNPLVNLHLNTRISEKPFTDIINIIGRQPDLLVGADGLWSKIRTCIENRSALFSGNVALRFLVSTHKAPNFIDHQSINAFLGPNAHLVIYPLPEISSINIVVITSCPENMIQETYGHIAQPSEHTLFMNSLSSWNQKLKHLVLKAENPFFWPLFQCHCDHWHNGRDTVLIGDAAHAMLPFAAQGANMAIEDAYILAAFLAQKPISEAIISYQENRKTRIHKVYNRINFNRFIFHLKGPNQLFRNIALKIIPPAQLSKNLNWLYGYKSII